MRIEGHRDFDAPRGDVFAALVDPQLVADSLPGVSKVDVDGPTSWSADVRLPMLPAAPAMRLRFALVERREPEHARLEAAGKRLGASFRLDTDFDLEERTDGGTGMRYAVELKLGGLLAGVAGPVVEPVARHMVKGLLDAVERRAAR